MPTPQGISNIKANLLRPALTSHYDVFIGQPLSGAWRDFRDYNLSFDQIRLHLSCSEASLPGSSLATMEINNDFHGVTERHVHRRVFDDRIDLTFYVDADNYLPIRFFETWMKFASNEQISENGGNSVKSSVYTYSMRYHSEYVGSPLKITKFERDYKSELQYVFVDPFPISVASIPISYDSSSLLKCSVSLTYLRYYVEPQGSGGEAAKSNTTTNNFSNVNPLTQAQINKAYTTDLGLNFGNYTTTGGVPFTAAGASGNAIDIKTAYSSGLKLF